MASENPFAPAHSRTAFLLTSGCGEALRRLDEGLGEREPFLLVTGEPGIGKTALACEALARWESRVTAAWLAYPALAGTEFLEEILRRFGAEPPEGASRSRLLAAFEGVLAGVAESGRIAMIVVDDAHSLSLDHLEELRLLVNAALRAHRPLEVLLLGLPALATCLDDPALGPLRQRLAVRVHLEALPPAETRRYLQHRASASGADGPATFPKKTCREIAARTMGVPRQINALAAEALRVARAWGDRSVGVEHVQTAAAALGGFLPRVNIDDSEVDGDAPPAARSAQASSAKPVPTTAGSGPPAAKSGLLPSPASPPAAAKPAGAPAKPEVIAPSASPMAPATPAARRAEAPPVSSPVSPRSTPREAAPPPPATVSARRSPPPPIDDYAEAPVTATHHDPGEWVKRFVGDKGPLQLSSRARLEAGWEESVEGLESEAGDSESGAPRKDHGRPRGRARHGRSAGRLVIVLLAGLVLIAAAVLVLRSGILTHDRSSRRAVAASAEPSRRVDRPASLDGGRAVATAPAEDPRAGSATVTPAAPSMPAAPPRVEEPAGSKRPFTIDVGGSPDLDAAIAARNRLSQLTGIHGWVVPGDANGSPYRVVLGIFKSQERAAWAAAMLVKSRTLEQARVVSLPPPRLRQ